VELSISDRMRCNYEGPCKYLLTRRMPVVVRVDGRAFHTLTKKLDKPFDRHFINAMHLSAIKVAEDMQGFKAAYIQSDEASFLMTDYDTLQTEGWFGYELAKIVSISASVMSVNFSKTLGYDAVFDSRAFNIPREEVTNYFLSRSLDWKRNSIQMYAQSCFSHKQLHKKSQADMHEMLHGIGKNWTTDLTNQEKNGTWLISGEQQLVTKTDMRPCYEEINKIIEPFISTPEQESADS